MMEFGSSSAAELTVRKVRICYGGISSYENEFQVKDFITCVVGTNDKDQIGFSEIVINFIHFQYVIIADTSFSQQNVQLSRHTTCK